MTKTEGTDSGTGMLLDTGWVVSLLLALCTLKLQSEDGDLSSILFDMFCFKIYNILYRGVLEKKKTVDIIIYRHFPIF